MLFLLVSLSHEVVSLEHFARFVILLSHLDLHVLQRLASALIAEQHVSVVAAG